MPHRTGTRRLGAVMYKERGNKRNPLAWCSEGAHWVRRFGRHGVRIETNATRCRKCERRIRRPGALFVTA